jgi:hypothetical protein
MNKFRKRKRMNAHEPRENEKENERHLQDNGAEYKRCVLAPRNEEGERVERYRQEQCSIPFISNTARYQARL